jgi:hypothetical protein
VREQIIDVISSFGRDVGQHFEKLRRPIIAALHFALERSHHQLIAANAQGARLPIDGL